jgi:hypothetical protein
VSRNLNIMNFLGASTAILEAALKVETWTLSVARCVAAASTSTGGAAIATSGGQATAAAKPTTQVIEQIQQIPEIQVAKSMVEVPQVAHKHVWTKSWNRLWRSQRSSPRSAYSTSVEMIADVPVPTMQQEVVLIPTVVNHYRHHHVEQDVIVDVHVPHEQEDIIHAPKIIPPEWLIRQAVEQIAQVAMITKVQKTVEVPQIECVDHHTHVPARKQRHAPMVTVAQNLGMYHRLDLLTGWLKGQSRSVSRYQWCKQSQT